MLKKAVVKESLCLFLSNFQHFMLHTILTVQKIEKFWIFGNFWKRSREQLKEWKTNKT